MTESLLPPNPNRRAWHMVQRGRNPAEWWEWLPAEGVWRRPSVESDVSDAWRHPAEAYRSGWRRLATTMDGQETAPAVPETRTGGPPCRWWSRWACRATWHAILGPGYTPPGKARCSRCGREWAP